MVVSVISSQLISSHLILFLTCVKLPAVSSCPCSQASWMDEKIVLLHGRDDLVPPWSQADRGLKLTVDEKILSRDEKMVPF